MAQKMVQVAQTGSYPALIFPPKYHTKTFLLTKNLPYSGGVFAIESKKTKVTKLYFVPKKLNEL